MTDETAVPASRPRDTKSEVIEDAVVVDESTQTPVVVETVHPTETEPVVATADPASTATASTAPASERVVYVELPPAPRKQGNRGFGALIAVVGTIVFTALMAIATAIIGVARTGVVSFGFLTYAEFYIPTLFFLIAFLVLVLLANRANWWAYIVGSLVVGIVVYFGSIGLSLLGSGVLTNTPDEAAFRFAQFLGSPFVIVAGLLAREVSMWMGTAMSRRGRRLKARNAEARAAYDRELAEKRAENDRSATAAAPAV